jgi:ankyrin repeat protein
MRQNGKFQAPVAAVYDRRKFGFQTLVCFVVAITWSGVAFCGEIHKAAKAGDVEKVKAILKASPDVMNEKDEDVFTPLHIAAAFDFVEVAKVLLAQGADLEAKNFTGQTPLHMAVKAGHEEMVKLLLDKKADVHAKDKAGATPLHYAVVKSKSLIELLLSCKANVNSRSDAGETPLAQGIRTLETPSGLGDQVKKSEIERLKTNLEFLRKHGAKE